MAASQSWQITPSLASIQAVMKEVGATKTVLAIYFRNPYVLDDESRLKEAGAILASFGVSDTALLEVISGRFKPRAERFFNVQRWTEMPRGGHFAAMEEPELLVDDIRAFFPSAAIGARRGPRALD
jgi:pimeloyl-ACP methyl ester carboxylesterase